MAQKRGISVDKSNVLISAVKKAEDQEISIRLYESEGRQDTVTVRQR